MGIVEDEISEVKRLCAKVIVGSTLVNCLSSLVRVDLKHTSSIQLTVCLRFPKNYPNEIILVELKSRTLDTKLLSGLTKLCDEHLKQHLCEPQIIVVLKFLNKYLIEKPLCIVYGEILSLQELLRDSGELKASQKNSTICVTARGGEYFFKIDIKVPINYPEKCVTWDTHTSNLPVKLTRYLNGQAKEIARQCVEAPLRVTAADRIAPPFEPSPSLQKSISFIIEATKEFYQETCPICGFRCLPEDPVNIIENDSSDDYVERVFCGHLYHQKCLKKFLREPPFPPNGKICPASMKHARSDNSKYGGRRVREQSKPVVTSCGMRLSHDRWGMDVKLAEQRWAHQQARERELEEVIDFLQ